MADGQWSPLDESRVQSSRETQSLQGASESCLGPKAHHGRDAHQLTSPVAFLHLTVDQTSLCWLLETSVPKKSANDGSTGSFSLQFMHQ
jgi:hypothetical protein